MDDLAYTLRQLCKRNRDGGYDTQAGRLRTLMLMSRQLRELGFRQMRAPVRSRVSTSKPCSRAGRPRSCPPER